MTPTRADIEDFLTQHRIAMVGGSRNPKDFSRWLFREMRKQRAGVNIQTIRFYEGRRIRSAPPRSISGYRQYAETDLDDLRIIRRCKELGFMLNEIQQLLRLHRATTTLPISGRRPHRIAKHRRTWRRRLEQIEQKLRDLRSMRMARLAMLDRLETVGSLGCPAAPARNS